MAMSSAQPSALALLVTATSLFAFACGTQYSDPIGAGADVPAEGCAAWVNQSDCRADTANGCSFQPNPIGCHEGAVGCAPGACRSGDPFVRRSGQTLRLRGAPYRFTGSVSWGIAWGREQCRVTSMPDQEQALVRTFDDLVDLRASVLKIWAHQYYAGSSGTDYTSFERVVAAARRAGVRLIFVLENQWSDCSLGGTRDDAWFTSGYLSPYGGYALSFPEYVRGLVQHFRDEPTLLAWEIMHEAGTDDFAALRGFTERMTTVIRENDSNHLIALGTDAGDSPATNREGVNSNYRALHAHAAIDLLDVHDFTNEGGLTPSMIEIAAIAAELAKPVFAGAVGVEVTDTLAATLERRASVVDAKLNAALSTGYVGFLLYDYYPDWSPPGWSFDARTEDPLGGPNGVLARHAPTQR